MKSITIHSSKKDCVMDLTDTVQHHVQESTVTDGICTIFVHHTTCSITTADLDPGTDLDLLDALRSMLPQLHYRHPHDPNHTPDHIISSIIGPSLTIPIQSRTLVLGVWQRIILIELDGPRDRSLSIYVIATSV